MSRMEREPKEPKNKTKKLRINLGVNPDLAIGKTALELGNILIGHFEKDGTVAVVDKRLNPTFLQPVDPE
jgi:hypothetical protein